MRFSSKRWRWTGQLAVGDNETGFAEPVGSIVITDNTLPNRQPTFEALLPTGVDTICLRHQYTLSALQTVLGDFALSQFAVMTADKSDDETSFDDVVSYMSKYEMVSTYHEVICRNGDILYMYVVFPVCPHNFRPRSGHLIRFPFDLFIFVR